MNICSNIKKKVIKVIIFENNIDVCNCNVIHEDIVQEVRSNIPKEETLYSLSELFKVLGEPTRVKILYALLNAEMCVCDIAALFNMTQSAISHQLRILKQSRLVKYRREGKIVYYSLDDEHVKQIFDQGLVHISEK
ncbi:metalloregulator ArsR/SmtB family transcription factor [Clostridium sp. CX1]|uniref:ArsR/SmtB family transcription factor n=1 Tax=Clostridium TaxID=1485 RepID=UPI0021BFC65A|nr:metalloregulator ArsR/SmtB family transcription factor [Clostridium sp. CX1]MCT8978122.1 metalloregulator ArsR/SmtB family transcription factor [Clostridium sp. CX1]